MGKTQDEGLARLEHKVDMLLDIIMRLTNKQYVTEMKSGSHECPVCHVGVKYDVEMQDNSVTRRCGCKTGKIASINLEPFGPPSVAGRKRHEEDSGRDAASDGDNAAGGRFGSKAPRRY